MCYTSPVNPLTVSWSYKVLLTIALGLGGIIIYIIKGEDVVQCSVQCSPLEKLLCIAYPWEIIIANVLTLSPPTISKS